MVDRSVDLSNSQAKAVKFVQPLYFEGVNAGRKATTKMSAAERDELL